MKIDWRIYLFGLLLIAVYVLVVNWLLGGSLCQN